MKTERKDDEPSITQTRESEKQNAAEEITLTRGAVAVTGTNRQKMNMNTRRMTNMSMSPEEYVVQRCLRLETEKACLRDTIESLREEIADFNERLDVAISEYEELENFFHKYGEKCKILSVKDKDGNRDYDFISFYSVGSNDEDYDDWLELLGLTGEPNA